FFANIKGFGGNSTYHCFVSYSPLYNVAILGGGNDNANKVWRLNSDQSVTPLTDSPVGVGIQKYNVVNDPVSGNFLLMGQHQLYELDPRGSGTYTQLTGSNTPPSAVGDPVAGAASVISASIPNYGVVMYVTCNGSNCNVYLYKHAARSGDASSNSN